MLGDDLYVRVAALLQLRAGDAPPLIDYLRQLQARAEPLGGRDGLSLPEFIELLELSFGPAPERQQLTASAQPGYQSWRTRLDAQIHDLQQMAESGALSSDLRYYGLDAPSGARWYNFDPRSFLECAAAGCTRSPDPVPDVEREDADPSLAAGPDRITRNVADDIDPRVAASDRDIWTWEMLIRFLDAGQMYE